MSEIYHDEVEIEDFEFDEEDNTYYFPCPCGDRFQITLEELQSGVDIATCPTCSLVVKIIYDKVQFSREEEGLPIKAIKQANLETA